MYYDCVILTLTRISRAIENQFYIIKQRDDRYEKKHYRFKMIYNVFLFIFWVNLQQTTITNNNNF